jgi:pimeloyl-ACP methyl ester carboxylesterase
MTKAVEESQVRIDAAHIDSPDGVRIGYEKSGAGPALLLVHGTTSDRSRWQPVAARLSKHFTVIKMDRRGRGSSGDSADYGIEREFDDVVAVAESIGSISIVAHSFGAVCALEAAIRSRCVSRLVLYEPPLTVQDPPAPTAEPALDRIEELIAEGQPEAALIAFYRDVLRSPESEIQKQIGLENWAARVALAHTVPRELRAVRHYRLDRARAAALDIPVLLIVGAESPPRYQAATKFLSEILSRSEVQALTGQQHNAISMAPDLFLRVALDFLNRTGSKADTGPL